MKNLKLMAIFIIIAGYFFINSCEVYAAGDKSRDEIFLDAVKAYEKGDYKAAAIGFVKIAKVNKVLSPELYYNVGNSYLKLDDPGLALLWYKRAERLSPNDPDLKFNIGYIEKRLKDDFEIKKSIFSGDIFFLSGLISEPVIIKTGLFFNLLFWLSLVFFYFRQNQLAKSVMGVTGSIAFIFLSNSFYCYYEHISAREAVIIPSEVSVKSGTSDNAPGLFKLHSGTRVLVEDIQDGHTKISNGDDKMGWIKSDEAIKILSL